MPNMERLIQLISINNGLITELRRSTTSIIRQFLRNHGYNAECKDYYYIMYSRYNRTEYHSYVAEIADVPKFIPMIQNYKNHEKSLLKGIEDEFTEHQMIIINRINDDVEALTIPDNSVFGFSCTYISHFYTSYYALMLRRKNPNIKIVFGGYHMGFGDNNRDFTLASGIADVVVKDDGCQPMLDVIEGRLTHGIVTGVFSKDVTWPILSRLEVHMSKKIIPSVTSVGCPNQCAFCASSRPYTTYNLDDMYEYLKMMRKTTGFTGIEMADDNINATEARGLRICDMIERVGVEHWHCFGVPRNLTDKLIKALKKSNAVSIFLGAEGFSDDVYELMNKASGQTKDNAIDAIDRVCSHEVMACVGIIVGLPGETDEDDKIRYEICEGFYKKYGYLFDLLATTFKLFPNSRIYQEPDVFGVTLEPWDNKYIDAIPELSPILAKVPKKFAIEGIDRKVARERMEKLRAACPTTGMAKWDADKKYAEKGAFDDDV